LPKPRASCVAGSWYPGTAAEAAAAVDRYCGAWPAQPRAGVRGGILPHAGWLYSGGTAGATFAALAGQQPETCVVFGAVHVPGVQRVALSDHDGWETPLGTIACDQELGAAVMDLGPGLVAADGGAHRREHSIEIEVPFIQRRFPGARLLALMVPPDGHAAHAGEVVAQAASKLGRRVLYFGSTDLTHYGPRYAFTPKGVGWAALQWSKNENDRRMLDLIQRLDAEQAVPEAHENCNACGAGAIAAALAAARAEGATRAEILHHTTSHDILPEGIPEDFVGYGAAVFIGG